MDLHAMIHEEDGTYWAEVKEMPGCFASGRTLDEVIEGLKEAVGMCLPDYLDMAAASLDEPWSDKPGGAVRVDELKLVTA